MHVSDLATAHVLALNHLLEGGASKAFNVGTGIGVSVRQLIDAVGRVLGTDVTVAESQRRPGDPAMLVASPERLKTSLDWRPEYEDFQAIVETAVAWHRSRIKAEK